MEDRQIIPIACRFIPYDQWLVTHVDTSWKISQLKTWFIAKCISTSASTSVNIVTSAFPFLNVPPKPRPKPLRRPASPIVFAPDPRPKPRAISPIRFAPLGSPRGSIYSSRDGSSDEEGTTIAMGYEVDDESGDSDGDLAPSGGQLGRTQYLSHFDHRPSTARSVTIEQDTHTNQPLPHQCRPEHHSTVLPKTCAYDIRKLMLIRFSTGQLLEDHFRVDDCSLSPYELIEIHRVGEVFTLPRTVIEQYVQPYWEGWVKSLRVVARESQHHPSKKSKGKRLEKDRENEPSGRKRKTRLEWRDRWVFVKDGVLNLRKNRLDPNTAQLLPLDSLVEIRGSEHIGRSITASSGNPPHQQRIICAKFRSRVPTTRFADQGPHFNRNLRPAHHDHHINRDPTNFQGDDLQSLATRLASPFTPSQNTLSSRNHVKQRHAQPPPHMLTSSSTTLVSSTGSKTNTKHAINEKTSNSSMLTTTTVTTPSSVDAYMTPSSSGYRSTSKKGAGTRATKDEEGEEEHENVSVDETGLEADTTRGHHHISSDEDDQEEHVHPQQNFDSDNDNSLSSSGSLSSPVFAHSDDSDMGIGNPDEGGFGYGAHGWNSGYGFDRGAKLRKKKMEKVQGMRGNDEDVDELGEGSGGTTHEPSNEDGGGGADSSFVVINANDVIGDERDKEKEKDVKPPRKIHKKEKEKGKERVTVTVTEKERERENERPTPSVQKPNDSEWVVLDLGDDHAYKSFLRILHRHAPYSIFSSFLSSLSLPPMPTLGASSPSTPNPTPVQGSTPTTSPIVFAPAPPDHRRRQTDYEIAAIADPAPTSAFKDSETFRLPQQVSGLLEEGTKFLNTFGALPYPEWRIDLVTRARKCGLGGVNRGVEMHLWGGDLSSFESGSLNASERRASSTLSVNGSLELGSEEESLRRRKKKKADRKLTLEHENKAIGLERTESGSSVISKRNSISKRKSRGERAEGEDDIYFSADDGSGKGSGSESSELNGVPDSDDNDSGEESSDAEWMGWMADLYRQSTVYRDNRKKRKETNGKAMAIPQAEKEVWIQEDGYRLAQRERMALEPTGVVLSPQLQLLPAAQVSLASTPQHTPAPSITNAYADEPQSYSQQYSTTIGTTRLSSPSSNESLSRPRGRRLSFGMSFSPPISDPHSHPSYTSSPAITPSSSHHNHNRSNSQKFTSGLSHFASTGGIGSEFREREFVSGRRPSMPTLALAGHTTCQDSYSKAHSTVSSPQPSTVTFITATAEPLADTLNDKASRRASLTMSSLGRSSSRRRKKELESEKEKDKAKKEKAKGKEKEKEKGKEREKEEKERKGKEREKDETAQTDHSADLGKTTGKVRRPRLSLSTGSRQNLSNLSQQQLPFSQSPPPTMQSHVIRRMRSGSSLLSGGELEGDSHGRGVNNPHPGVKKRKTGLVREVSMRAEKLVQGLESALDFVDGR
ncbi:hypothetical protein E1B28_010801 [Marasmius oreades]|uniref:Uncharacterized protein n=1 Tax=Marasmius oreades TaxID=181124 RepID=A0A9P7RTB5_9AGAR|nr:uncharacterized protein E1B28_010801 [Marasmius oreades]KAG7089092.1 hypothetical protein E1B28_010801 [Marasmius oreades]